MICLYFSGAFAVATIIFSGANRHQLCITKTSIRRLGSQIATDKHLFLPMIVHCFWARVNYTHFPQIIVHCSTKAGTETITLQSGTECIATFTISSALEVTNMDLVLVQLNKLLAPSMSPVHQWPVERSTGEHELIISSFFLGNWRLPPPRRHRHQRQRDDEEKSLRRRRTRGA